MPVNSTRPDVCPRIFVAILFICLIVTMFFSVFTAWAGVEIDCNSSLKAYAIDKNMKNYTCDCRNGAQNMPVCTLSSSSGSSKKSPSSSKSGGLSTNNQIKLQLFQGVLDAVMRGPGNNAAAQQEAERQQQLQRGQKQRSLEFERQKNFAEKKDLLIGNLKGSSTGTLVDFKSLDGDAETMRKAAGDSFDQSSPTTTNIEITAGTNFFGTTLSKPEITTLMEPENDPIIVDCSC